ncbi:hypothetical protein [Rheinheimera sp.]|jgi:hypothetical protein|uniref:hypothetical protein n=1 Tax=Rheinheimera sp. TaxID=1869214 RepID=UPI003D2B5142
MPALLRTTLALLAGVVVTFFTISAVEQLGHILYRAPAGLDWQDSSAVSAYLKQLPAGALLLVLAGWLLGIFTGLTAATMLAGRCRGRFALAIGSLVFLGAVSNFYLLPHPLWLMVLSLIMIPLVSVFCWWALKKRFGHPAVAIEGENV